MVQLLRDFARSRDLKCTSDVRTSADPLLLATANFTDDEFVIVVWYVSDGANFALVTHTKQEFDAEEIGVAEAIVRSLLWTSTSRPRRLDS